MTNPDIQATLSTRHRTQYGLLRKYSGRETSPTCIKIYRNEGSLATTLREF